MNNRTVSIPLPQARDMAKAVLPHVLNDGKYPVMEHAVIRNGNVYATDRYTVIEYPLPDSRWSNDKGKVQHWDDWEGLLYVPHAALKVISALTDKSLTLARGYSDVAHVLIREGAESTTVEIVTQSGQTVHNATFPVSVGNYPPVWDLIDKWQPQEDVAPAPMFKAEHFTKVTKVLAKDDVFTITPGRTANGAQPIPPAMIEVPDRFRVLIQPNLRVRNL